MPDLNPADADTRLARIAAAMAEPARTRMLCCLLDGRARTATELAAVAEVAASTASAHLARLCDAGLLQAMAQGRHRYFRLAGEAVARMLENLLVLAGTPPEAGHARSFRPGTPSRLRAARTCYDHMAGSAGVAWHDHLHARQWLTGLDGDHYELTNTGARELGRLGLDVDAARRSRRRFACACLDWSERRPHLGGALGAACLQLALRRGWVQQALDGRALTLTPAARRDAPQFFGLV